MNFGLIPPEINSALMYAGPGAGPLLEASAAWGGLASDLSSSAAQCASAIQALDSCWQGPSAAAMSSASMKYVSWLQSTAAMAEISSSQATAAAAAYGTAFAATVPPPVIAANRIRLSVLVATNFLGINTAAIAATEAEYAAMWAADAAAMYGYQAASAAATSGLPEFQPAPQTTTGTTAQGITQPAASSGGWNIFAPGSNTETTGLAGLLNLLSGQTDSAFGSFINSSFLNSIGSSAVFNPGETYAPLAALAALLPAFQQMGQSMEGTSIGVGDSVSGFGGTGYGFSGLSGGNYPVVGATVGNGEAVGGLSAPPAWQRAVGVSSVRPMGATPLGNVSGSNMAVPMGLPVGGKGKDSQRQPRYGFPVKVVNSHPAGG